MKNHTLAGFGPVPILLSLLLAGCASGITPEPIIVSTKEIVVYPVIETEPVASTEDAADDPAIWVNGADPADSRVLGTNKQAGLDVYDLNGNRLQFLPSGRVNNVDLRQNLTIGSWQGDLAAASNRSGNVVTLYSIDPKGFVSELANIPVTGEPYGFCMGRRAGKVLAIVTHKDGMVRFWEVKTDADGFALELEQELKFDSQLEGCVHDDATGMFFVGEENHGIWKVEWNGEQQAKASLIDLTGSATGLTADVEGLDIFHGNSGEKYLIASSQGSNRYVIYDLVSGGKAVLVLDVDTNILTGIDGTSETDGLAVVSAALGEQFPNGMLVVQDGFNRRPVENQNFKFIDWRDVQGSLPNE